MATRGAAAKLQTLIDQVSQLEELGGLVQGEQEAAGLAAADQLAVAYRRWFSASLEALPEDLRERFRFEYEGSIGRYRIKTFVQGPRTKSPMYREDMEESSKLIWGPWQHPFKDRFLGPIREQQQYLEQALARLGTSSATLDALELLEQLARRLPITLAILTASHRGRQGLTVNDEYDVQHVLHAIAVLHFEEVEPEEPTPKMAGASSRLDFLIKQERVAIETKMMRDTLSKNQLRKDLANDIVYFRAHPNVSALFVLVFDPKREITNATGFERDLHSDSDEFLVRVVIAS